MQRCLKIPIDRYRREGRVGDLIGLLLRGCGQLLCMTIRNESFEGLVDRLNKWDAVLVLVEILLRIGGQATRQAHKGRALEISEHGTEDIVVHSHL